MKKAISVLSGGLDCTVATSVFDEEYEIHAITFDYGQKAAKQEINASKRICEKMGWMHEVIDLPWLSKISTSSLNTDADIPELGEDDLDDLDKSSETASNVWVPARNTVFTSIASVQKLLSSDGTVRKVPHFPIIPNSIWKNSMNLLMSVHLIK